MIKNGSVTLEWEAHDYEHKERSSDWFWAAGIVTLAIAFASIIFGNIIFGVLILVSAVSLALFINRPPENIHASVTDKGIQREKTFYPFETLESFWIDIEHPHNKIILRSKKMFMPLILVPLGTNINAEQLHTHLEKHLKEEYHSLPFVEKILEYLGF
ncbi:MAG: hypothetical protein AAB660_02610 [Patescibacteria group bacterium]